MMAVVFMVTIMVTMTMPLLQEQIAIREINTIARRFTAHAHFARGQAIHLGQSTRIMPRLQDSWDQGWVVATKDKVWLTQGSIEPVFFRGGGRHFVDPHSGKSGIGFNAAGAAKTAQGGFVANRLILRHRRSDNLERQLILSSGGRWRICDPARDVKNCH